jgi:hypothetical protein
MKRYKGIVYSFQPESYWDDSTVLQALLRDVKGVQRRKMIIDYFENNEIDKLNDMYLQAELTDEQRYTLGLIHPSFMGGEYLPGCGNDETEIARIELQSTLADVTSIRAKRNGDEYQYSIVDEYGDTYDLNPKTSINTFTLDGLIIFIDYSEQVGGWSGGLSLSYNNANAESLPREQLRNFTKITSDIYPELEEHYENLFCDWVVEGEDWKKEQEEGMGLL